MDGIYSLMISPFELTVLEGVIVDIIPDTGSNLKGTGVLSWTDVSPGSTLSGSFTLENSGEPGSTIDWDIVAWPEWGFWTFTPENGEISHQKMLL
jgi:hypothetical protein